MSSPDPDAAFAVLRDADPEVMDRDQLAGVTRHIAQLIGVVRFVQGAHHQPAT